MSLRGPLLRHRKPLQSALVLAACAVIWVLRRPEQLTRPYVWVEESYIIKNFLEDGWAGAFEPIQGYLLLPANVLVALATNISFMQLPDLMYAFGFAVFVATVLLLLLPESRWGDLTTRSSLALTMALVPTNPEVFGVLLYSFWWTTLWPLIVLGWKRDLWLLRAPVLIVGTLSSPAGGALFAVFAVAYLLNRRIRELLSAGILLAGFVFQVIIALDSSRAELLSRDADPMAVLEQTFRTGGLFETQWLSPGNGDRYFLLLAGLAFLSVAALRLSFAARRHEVLLLLMATGVFTVLSAVPAPLVSDPAGAGPRYYFLPFVAFGWVLIALWRRIGVDRLRTASAVLFCLSLLGLATTFSRASEETTARLSWEAEVRKCAISKGPVAQIPIYFDGSNRMFMYPLELSPAECGRLSQAFFPPNDRPVAFRRRSLEGQSSGQLERSSRSESWSS
jgi:hypothetical protein